MKENVILDKSKAFALRIIRLYQFLCETKKEYVLSKQVLRSGTSIGANAKEAAHLPDLFHIGMSLSLSQIVLGLKQSKV